jgi:hypothetical protein
MATKKHNLLKNQCQVFIKGKNSAINLKKEGNLRKDSE